MGRQMIKVLARPTNNAKPPVEDFLATVLGGAQICRSA